MSAATLQTALGIVVRTCRQKLGITQEELAWRADLHRTYIADVERGARNLSLQSIANLAEALQVTAGESADIWSGGLALADENHRPRKLGEILLVEDEAADVELTVRALKRAALENPVRAVRNGQEAVDYFFAQNKRARRRARATPADPARSGAAEGFGAGGFAPPEKRGAHAEHPGGGAHRFAA